MRYTINNNTSLDLTQLKDLTSKFLPFAQKRIGFNRPPVINFDSDETNAKNPLGSTAHYDPNNMEIVIYIDGRHIKDILRSLAHELVHHCQNCKGKFNRKFSTQPGYAQSDKFLRGMEEEAYKIGNLCFRDWEDEIKQQLPLYETIYRETLLGGETMSVKSWKDQELNNLLMEKWGFKPPVKKKKLDEDLDAYMDSSKGGDYATGEWGTLEEDDEEEEEEEDEEDPSNLRSIPQSVKSRLKVEVKNPTLETKNGPSNHLEKIILREGPPGESVILRQALAQLLRKVVTARQAERLIRNILDRMKKRGKNLTALERKLDDALKQTTTTRTNLRNLQMRPDFSPRGKRILKRAKSAKDRAENLEGSVKALLKKAKVEKEFNEKILAGVEEHLHKLKFSGPKEAAAAAAAAKKKALKVNLHKQRSAAAEQMKMSTDRPGYFGGAAAETQLKATAEAMPNSVKTRINKAANEVPAALEKSGHNARLRTAEEVEGAAKAQLEEHLGRQINPLDMLTDAEIAALERSIQLSGVVLKQLRKNLKNTKSGLRNVETKLKTQKAENAPVSEHAETLAAKKELQDQIIGHNNAIKHHTRNIDLSGKKIKSARRAQSDAAAFKSIKEDISKKYMTATKRDLLLAAWKRVIRPFPTVIHPETEAIKIWASLPRWFANTVWYYYFARLIVAVGSTVKDIAFSPGPERDRAIEDALNVGQELLLPTLQMSPEEKARMQRVRYENSPEARRIKCRKLRQKLDDKKAFGAPNAKPPILPYTDEQIDMMIKTNICKLSTYEDQMKKKKGDEPVPKEDQKPDSSGTASPKEF